MTDWPFGTDADRDDPLTDLRIAVTGSHPGWFYLVAFDRESEERPTAAEALLLASFLDEYKHHWYDPGYLAKLAQRPLDVDGGANGVVFHKFGEDDWGYRRHSYTQGWAWSVIPPGLRGLPEYDGAKNAGPFSLAALMDRIHTIIGDEPMDHWQAWKAAHPDVFEVVTR
jgi:hypothetical protein